MIRIPAIDDESSHSPVLLQTIVTKIVASYVTSSMLEMSLAKGGCLPPPELVLNHLAYACLKTSCRVIYEVS